MASQLENHPTIAGLCSRKLRRNFSLSQTAGNFPSMLPSMPSTLLSSINWFSFCFLIFKICFQTFLDLPAQYWILHQLIRLARQIPELGQNSGICVVLFSHLMERENTNSLKVFITFYKTLKKFSCKNVSLRIYINFSGNFVPWYRGINTTEQNIQGDGVFSFPAMWKEYHTNSRILA